MGRRRLRIFTFRLPLIRVFAIHLILAVLSLFLFPPPLEFFTFLSSIGHYFFEPPTG